MFDGSPGPRNVGKRVFNVVIWKQPQYTTLNAQKRHKTTTYCGRYISITQVIYVFDVEIREYLGLLKG